MLQIILMVLTQTVSSIALPVFSKLQDREEKLLSVYYTVSAGIAVVSFPVCVGLAISIPEFVDVVLGAKWVASVDVVRIVTFLGATTTISYFNGALLLSTGRSDLRFYVTAVRALIGTALFMTFHVWGLLGMAAAFAIRSLTTEFLQLFFVARSSSLFSWRSYFGPVIRTAVCTLLMALGLILLRQYAFSSLTELHVLIFTVVSGVILYSAITWLLNRRTIFESIYLIRGTP